MLIDTLSIQDEILERLEAVTSNSLIGVTIKSFCRHAGRYHLIPEMVKTIKDQIKDNEPSMVVIMGAESVQFFKHLILP